MLKIFPSRKIKHQKFNNIYINIGAKMNNFEYIYRPFHKTLPRSNTFVKLDFDKVLQNGLYFKEKHFNHQY